MSAVGCTPDAFDKKSLMMVLNGWNDLKNGALALRAFGQAHRTDPDLHLVCFGAGYERDGLAHRWAKGKNLDHGVGFWGPVPHDTILKHMQSSTALLHPSRWEACCMAIAEAMSVGLPVIAGRHTDGVAWQLDDGRAGTLADITKVDDVARGIIAMTRDRYRWTEMSAAARARARQLFSVDRVVDQYVSLYETLPRPRAQASSAYAPP
jgi:glycosyltransferase involved in cell wall biosynthesis